MLFGSRINRPLTKLLASCWHIQLHTYSRLLGRNHQKPMHPVPQVLHFERVLYHSFRLGDSPHAGVFHFPPPAIYFTAHFHQ